MSVISCPRCEETVRVPEAISNASSALPDGLVQCPWCREKLAASEVTARLPPMLELVSADGTALLNHSVDNSVDPSLDQSSVDIASAGVVEDISAFDAEPDFDEFQLSEPIENAGPSIAAVSLPAGASRSRSGAKKGSGIGSIIKMALGGLMAIPIAATILTLVGRPLPIDFGFFPFQGDGSGDRGSVNVAAPPRRVTPSPEQTESASQTPPRSRVIQPAEIDPASSNDFEFATTEPSAADAALAEIQEAAELPEAGLEMPEVPGGGVFSTNDRPKEPPLIVRDIKDATESIATEAMDATDDLGPVLSPELTTAIADAGTVVDEAVYLTEVEAKDTRVFQDAYRKTAEVAALLDEESAKHESILDLIKRLASSDKLTEKYATVGPRWPRVKGRKTDGILLIGQSKQSGGEKSIDFGNDLSLPVQFSTELPDGRIIALGKILQKGSEDAGADTQMIKLFAVQPL